MATLIGQDEKKAESDAAVAAFKATLGKTKVGDAEAVYGLGIMAIFAEELKEAVKWFRKAAEMGNADAMFQLGIAHASGRGVIQDFKEAGKWFRKAAELGDTDAMFHFGVMHTIGKGVIEDDKEAVKWYRKAAELASTFLDRRRRFKL